MNSFKRYLYASITGIALFVAWSPHAYTSPLLWFAFLPLFMVIEDLIQHESVQKKGRKVFKYAFCSLLIWNVSCVYWVYHSIAAYNDAMSAFFISLIPFLLMPLLMSIPFWAYYQWRKQSSPLLAWSGFIGLWIGFEYLQQYWELAFPWMNLGNGFAQFHQLIQWYDVTGVYGGSIWILIINILAFQFLLSKEKKWLFFSIVFLVIPSGISIYKYVSYTEKYNPCSVVVVQPNIDPYAKNTGGVSAQDQINTLIKESNRVAKPNTEYFIWPETAISDFVDESKVLSNPQLQPIQSFLFNYKNANLISGFSGYQVYPSAQESPTAERNPSDGMYYDSFNAALQLDNNPTVQIYHKSKLVPGVERMPFAQVFGFLKPYFAHFGGSIGGYGYQNEPSVFYAESGIATAPVICYESIWGDWVAESVRKGAQFIAIMTNDAWWGNTSGKDQHEQYAKLRAIENRRWIARAANTGISCFINAKGDMIQQSKWWTQTALQEEINLNSEKTFYTLHGDYLVGLCLGLAVITFLIGIVQKLKKKS